MAHRIPSEDEVAKAIEDCLVRSPHMRSQRELCEAVSAELMCLDEFYRIGPERIRRIGISRGLFTLGIRYAETGRRVGTRCPVCGGGLEPALNRTLEGGVVELMRVCGACGFVAKGTAVRPARYTVDRRVRAWTGARGRRC